MALFFFKVCFYFSDYKSVSYLLWKDRASIANKMESRLFLLSPPERATGRFPSSPVSVTDLAELKWHCTCALLHFTNVNIILTATRLYLLWTFTVYVTVSCSICKWFTLYIMTLYCTCKELSNLCDNILLCAVLQQKVQLLQHFSC
jgi:hypothetical protein